MKQPKGVKPLLPIALREKFFLAWQEEQVLAYVQRKCNAAYRTVVKYRKIDKWDKRLKEIHAGVIKKNDHNAKSNLNRRVQAARIVRKKAMQTVIKEGIDKGKAGDIALKALDLEHKMLTDVPDKNQTMIIVNVTGMPRGLEDV